MSAEVRFCVRCAAQLELQPKFGSDRPVCPRCGWIYLADPKVAVAVLVERADGVLLVQRTLEPGQGLWTVPAGFMDAWEDPARAAERECFEETGLEVRVSALLDIYAGREHPRGADLVIGYKAEIVGGELRAGDDAGAAAFFPRSQFPPLAFKATRRILGLG